MHDHLHREGDAGGRGFRGVRDGEDPCCVFECAGVAAVVVIVGGVITAERLVARKETARVAVRSAAEEDEVEDGHADGVARGEGLDQLCLVVVGKGLELALFLSFSFG